MVIVVVMDNVRFRLEENLPRDFNPDLADPWEQLPICQTYWNQHLEFETVTPICIDSRCNCKEKIRWVWKRTLASWMTSESFQEVIVMASV